MKSRLQWNSSLDKEGEKEDGADRVGGEGEGCLMLGY